MKMKRIILCFVGGYLPGYKYGGPIRSIANLVDQIGDEFDFFIITRDRDLGDEKPYAGVDIDSWNKVGKAWVFYASNKTINLRGIGKLLRDTPHDVLYLNSFFSYCFTCLPLLSRWLNVAPGTPCLIAPRGEFSSGAIALKGIKKRAYIVVVKLMGIYSNVYWQASSTFEKEDIQRRLGSIAQQVHVAPNLTVVVHQGNSANQTRAHGPLRLLFLSRISPKKNLDFLLNVLSQITHTVELTICGPQEDPLYFDQCRALMNQLPSNISIKIVGHVPPEQVPLVFAANDLFVFPSRGENFGHVVFESLAAGTPVLVSDQTPWHTIESGGLEVLPLVESKWVHTLQNWATSNEESMVKRRLSAVQFASVLSADIRSIEKYRDLFNKMIAFYKY